MTGKAVVKAIGARPGEVGFVCALGLPLGIPGIVKKAHDNFDVHVGLDGCNVQCATKALQSVGVVPAESIVVTEEIGVKKSDDMVDETGLDRLVESVLERVDRFTSTGS
jgi:uncharacterized metal-binding protein